MWMGKICTDRERRCCMYTHPGLNWEKLSKSGKWNEIYLFFPLYLLDSKEKNKGKTSGKQCCSCGYDTIRKTWGVFPLSQKHKERKGQTEKNQKNPSEGSLSPQEVFSRWEDVLKKLYASQKKKNDKETNEQASPVSLFSSNPSPTRTSNPLPPYATYLGHQSD